MADERTVSRDVERKSFSVAVDGGELFAWSVRPANHPGGPTVLFVHGKTFPSVPDFDLQVPGAAKTHSYMEYLARRGTHCFCFDHRGFGASWKPEEGSLFTSEVRARDLIAVVAAVRRLSASPLAIAGLSLGCATIAAALERDAAIADRIVLIGPSGWRRLGTSEAESDRQASIVKSGAQRSTYIRADFPSLEKRLWVGEEALVSRPAFEEFVRQAIAANPAGTDSVTALISSIVPFAGTPALRVPVLAVRGGDDTLATQEDLEAVRRFVDPALLATRVFARRKHDLHLYNEREDVFESIHAFVAS
ncbi:MAG: alpha/beta hydrolase [Usitatibacter sp.]